MVTMKDNENIYTTQYQNVTNLNDSFTQATIARTCSTIIKLKHNNNYLIRVSILIIISKSGLILNIVSYIKILEFNKVGVPFFFCLS